MKTFIVLSALLLFLPTACRQATETPIPTPPLELSVTEKQIVSADNSFGFKLFTRINSAEQGKNVFISPLSVSMALGMTMNGANGATYDSMQRTLELQGYTVEQIQTSYQNIISVLTQLDPKVIFQIANSIWYRNTFQVETDFLDANKKYFNAEITPLDFNSPTAVDIINAWVNTKTKGKIPTIIDNPIEPEVIMYLINAIYFKGTWTYEFDASKTKDTLFTKADGSKIPCKLMIQKASLSYCFTDGCQVLDLFYGDGKFSMTIILPPAGTTIDAFTASLTQERWNTFVSGLAKTDITVELPKFKLEYKRSLNDELKAMGMAIAFSGQADFTRINKNGGLSISNVLHKTFVEVDEQGTTAAAVTSVEIWNTVIQEILMRIDRPFIFAIREHESGTVLFIGKIVEPAL